MSFPTFICGTLKQLGCWGREEGWGDTDGEEVVSDIKLNSCSELA